jgi:thiamine pyrophosphate-dependent acetolactate synthase large subunit-like protein
VDGRADIMGEQWLTYAEAAVRLGSNADAVRKRAARCHWSRRTGNDGKVKVLVPDETSPARPAPVRADIVGAMQAHIEDLRAELAGEKERTDKLSAELSHRDEQLATARAAADKATGELVALARRLAAIAEERARPWWRRLLRKIA